MGIKSKQLAAGLMAAAITVTLSGCGTELPPPPELEGCDDWDWEEELGVYQCDDDDSDFFRGYYYAGKMFKTKDSLKTSKSYIDYSKGSSFKGNSGFGTGVKGSTGS